MFIGELSVLDNSPFWHFDEEFCKWHISNHNLKREKYTYLYFFEQQ